MLRRYRFRVFDSRNGEVYGSYELDFDTDTDDEATAEAQELRVMLGVMLDEVKVVDTGETPEDGWRAIEHLREVQTI